MEYLRGEMLRGRWGKVIPGLPQLSMELEVNPKTVAVALRLLEEQGLLVPQGMGKRRRIALPGNKPQPQKLRIGILLYDRRELTEGYMVELQHMLQTLGCEVFFCNKGLVELEMNVRRVVNQVRQETADAWVVQTGSKEVLRWFVNKSIPAFALFGRRRELRIAGAGPDKEQSYRQLVRRLVELGHQRIVLLVLKVRRLPTPGMSERAFLDELEAQGIPTSPFNLPDWEESAEGVGQLLDSLFDATPPTALVIDEAYLFHAVKQHLSRQGIRAPEDVSLICTDPDRTFDWCRPSIAHITWDPLEVARCVRLWAKHLTHGKDTVRQRLTTARLVEGGTIGPAKGSGAEGGDFLMAEKREVIDELPTVDGSIAI